MLHKPTNQLYCESSQALELRRKCWTNKQMEVNEVMMLCCVMMLAVRCCTQLLMRLVFTVVWGASLVSRPASRTYNCSYGEKLEVNLCMWCLGVNFTLSCSMTSWDFQLHDDNVFGSRLSLLGWDKGKWMDSPRITKHGLVGQQVGLFCPFWHWWTYKQAISLSASILAFKATFPLCQVGVSQEHRSWISGCGQSHICQGWLKLYLTSKQL